MEAATAAGDGAIGAAAAEAALATAARILLDEEGLGREAEERRTRRR